MVPWDTIFDHPEKKTTCAKRDVANATMSIQLIVVSFEYCNVCVQFLTRVLFSVRFQYKTLINRLMSLCKSWQKQEPV